MLNRFILGLLFCFLLNACEKSGNATPTHTDCGEKGAPNSISCLCDCATGYVNNRCDSLISEQHGNGLLFEYSVVENFN
jgi:hypothetical protein